MSTNWVAANNPRLVDVLLTSHRKRGHIMDAVVIGSILAVGITIVIVIYLIMRVVYLMNHTHSED
jgi:hypothetical protein